MTPQQTNHEKEAGMRKDETTNETVRTQNADGEMIMVSTGENPHYQKPIMRWNRVSVVARPGTEFGVVVDSERRGSLVIAVRRPGETWPCDSAGKEMAPESPLAISPGACIWEVFSDNKEPPRKHAFQGDPKDPSKCVVCEKEKQDDGWGHIRNALKCATLHEYLPPEPLFMSFETHDIEDLDDWVSRLPAGMHLPTEITGKFIRPDYSSSFVGLCENDKDDPSAALQIVSEAFDEVCKTKPSHGKRTVDVLKSAGNVLSVYMCECLSFYEDTVAPQPPWDATVNRHGPTDEERHRWDVVARTRFEAAAAFGLRMVITYALRFYGVDVKEECAQNERDAWRLSRMTAALAERVPVVESVDDSE